VDRDHPSGSVGDDAHIRRLLRGHGLRSTPQRIAIIKTLIEAAAGTDHDHNSTHLTVPEIHDRLRDNQHIDQSTIYRVVAVLAEEGVLHAIAYVDRPSAYGIAGTAHHHAVCVTCGIVYEITPSHVKLAIDQLAEVTGFRHTDMRLTIHGQCPACPAPPRR
jgi:Fe2+ or Zn2+ uptake regulation protein